MDRSRLARSTTGCLSGFTGGSTEYLLPGTFPGYVGRLLVMHDRDDEVVPAAESRRLVEAAEGLVDVRYTEFVAFDHVTPRDEGMAGLLRQGLRLYRHMRDVLSIAY